MRKSLTCTRWHWYVGTMQNHTLAQFWDCGLNNCAKSHSCTISVQHRPSWRFCIFKTHLPLDYYHHYWLHYSFWLWVLESKSGHHRGVISTLEQSKTKHNCTILWLTTSSATYYLLLQIEYSFEPLLVGKDKEINLLIWFAILCIRISLKASKQSMFKSCSDKAECSRLMTTFN